MNRGARYRIWLTGLMLAGLLQHQASWSQTVRTVTHSFTVQPIMLLDIEPDISVINFSIAAPTEAGDSIIVSALSDDSKWLNYTSFISPGQRRVDVQVIGTLPPGLDLRLSVGNYSGSGGGTTGNPNAMLSLSNTAQPCIMGIGKAFTGTGVNNGHRLTYSPRITDWSSLQAGSTTLTIQYTIMDN